MENGSYILMACCGSSGLVAAVVGVRYLSYLIEKRIPQAIKERRAARGQNTLQTIEDVYDEIYKQRRRDDVNGVNSVIATTEQGRRQLANNLLREQQLLEEYVEKARKEEGKFIGNAFGLYPDGVPEELHPLARKPGELVIQPKTRPHKEVVKMHKKREKLHKEVDKLKEKANKLKTS